MATQDISQLVVEVKSTGILTAANQLDKLATNADKAEAAVKKLGTAVLGANGMLTGGVANATALATAMVSLTVVLERMATTQTRATVSTRANNEAMAEAHALARGLSGSLGALWVTYGNFAGMAVGIALGASLKGVIGVGKDVEQTLEGIRVLGGATTSEMVKMSNAISELGTGTSGPREVAEALKTLTLAGLNAEQSLKGVGAALNLAIGGEVSIEKSASTLVQVGSALGYSAASYDQIADVIVKTAAASMSSVESISGAFKSAAAVGTVYGASLEDIAIGLAAVANLGIQGTAAGTALKNLYKDLSASTDKVTNTLKDMKMSITSFRDADGFMLPLVEVIQKLDAGMNTLSSQARNLAMVKLFGQQGVREGAALISLLHQAAYDTEKYGTTVDATHNKLVELQDQIRNSAATAALAAIQMAQTTENQLKSVKNTLLVTFSKVFTDIQPQIGAIARGLREAFASEEFKSGLKMVISLLVDFTKVLFDNAAILRDVAIGIAGAKFLEMASGMRLAAGAAATFQAALGPIALLITGLTVAWKMYKAEKDRALSNKDAEGNLEDYISKVQKETEKQVSLYNLRLQYGSDAEAQRAQEIVDRKEASNKAIDDAKAGVQKLLAVRDGYWLSMKESEKKKAQEFMQMDEEQQQAALKKRQFFGNTGLADNFGHYMEASMAYAKSQALVADQAIRAKNAVEALTVAGGANADWANAEAKKNRIVSPGDGELTGKGGSKADAYAAAIAQYTLDIKAANQMLEQAREKANAEFKAGEIGKLQLIEQVADAEIATAKRIARDASAAADIAASHVGKDGKADKTADVERFRAEADRANSEAIQADKMRNANKLVAERQMQTEIVALQVKTSEEQGRFVEAANLKWSSSGKLLWQQAQADAANSGSETAKAYVVVQNEIMQAAMNTAQLKEDTVQFNTSLAAVQGTMKGFKEAAYGASLDTIFDNATNASKKFDSAMAVAKDNLESLLMDAALTNSPEAWKKYTEGAKELASAADGIKSKWVEVGDTISNSLSDAFGKPGKALGDLSKAMLEFKNTQNASQSDRIKQYGDMAQAASGFFDKQSKGYKALNTISEVFHIEQMARTLQQTAASVIAGVANFFGQSGWGGFAGVAAMGAVLAGVGYTMAGGSSHADASMDAEYVQKHQGTGTVLGDADAKSESITKSIDALKANSDSMLPISMGMLAALKNIESSMVGVAKLAIQNGVTNGSNFDVKLGQLNAKGSPTDMISNVMTHVTDGLFGPVIGGKLASIANNLWGKVKAEIADSGLQLGGKVSDLQSGKGINQYAAVKTTTSSWFGLAKSSNTDVKTQGVGDEMSKQFGLIFSNLEEAMKVAAPALGASASKVGEAIEGMVIDTKKISLKDLKGDDLTSAINSVISAAMDQVAKSAYPQMQDFQQLGEGYAQTVMRVASGVEQAGAALKKLGVQAIDYANIQNKQGDVAFEIAKQSIVSAETAITTYTRKRSSFFSAIFGVTTVFESQLSGVGEIIQNMSGSIDDLTSAYKTLVDIRDQMNYSGLNGNSLNLKMVQGAGGLSQLQSALHDYQSQYLTDGEQAGIMLKSVTAEFKKIGVELPVSKSALRALIETTSKSNPELTGQLLSLADAYSKTVDAAQKARDTQSKALDDQSKTLQDTIKGLKSFKEALMSLKDSLALGAMSILTPTEKYVEAKRQYEDTVSKAMAGDSAAQSNVSSASQAYLDASRVINASSEDYTSSYNQVQTDIEKLAADTDGKLTNAEQQLAALQAQSDSLAKLNDTASGILDAISGVPSSNASTGANVTSPAAPVVPVASVSVDTSKLEAEISDLKKQMAEQKADSDKQMADLTAALYDSSDKNAKNIGDAVTSSASTASRWTQLGKTLTTER